MGGEAQDSTGGSPAASHLDAHATLETGVRALSEMVEALAREYREAASQERAQAADRAFSKFMKAHAELAKCVKQVEAGRTVRNEFRKTIPQIVHRCTSAFTSSILPLMRANAKRIREEIVEYANGRLSPEEFWKRLVQYEREWPEEIGNRIRVAQTQALKAEEAKVGG